jgi:hypothetical protein
MMFVLCRRFVSAKKSRRIFIMTQNDVGKRSACRSDGLPGDVPARQLTLPVTGGTGGSNSLSAPDF